MTGAPQPSSEPKWIKVLDGSDRDWRLISMYELKELEHAINEECVGKTDACPPGHLKEMHDSGNEVIDKVRSRPATTSAGEVLDFLQEKLDALKIGNFNGVTTELLEEWIEELQQQQAERERNGT